MSQGRPLSFVVVSGSHRLESQSLKVASFFARLLREAARRTDSTESDVVLVDLARESLPLMHDEEALDDPKWEAAWAPLSDRLSRADGFVFVTPEWAGMVTPALKNLFLLCADNGELANKPAVAVGVSSGVGGAYPVMELRMMSGKNTHVCYIPEHVVVRDVSNVLNEADAASEQDARLRERMTYVVDLLVEYARALRMVRASGVVDRERFPYGM